MQSSEVEAKKIKIFLVSFKLIKNNTKQILRSKSKDTVRSVVAQRVLGKFIREVIHWDMGLQSQIVNIDISYRFSILIFSSN